MIWQINVFSQFYDLPIRNQENYKLFYEEIQKSFRNSKSFSNKDTSLRLLMVFNLHPIDTITKEEYTDGSFLKKLKYDYVYNKSKNKSFKFLKDSMVYAININVYSRKTNSNVDYFIANFSYGHMRFFNNQEKSDYFKRQHIKMFLNYRRDKRRASKKPPEVCTDINRIRLSDIWGGSDTHLKLREYVWDKGNFFIFRVPDKKLDVFFIINEQLEIFVFFNNPYEYEHEQILPIKEFIDKYWDCFSNEHEFWFTRC
ncbi:MAG: hypothetical protein FWF65_02115 [Bacteroidetes bacterium]|nr:hypothetical protein [Bacteroidota bacterium]